MNNKIPAESRVPDSRIRLDGVRFAILFSNLKPSAIESLFKNKISPGASEKLASTRTYVGEPVSFRVALSKATLDAYRREGHNAGLFIEKLPPHEADIIGNASFVGINSGLSHYTSLLSAAGIPGAIYRNLQCTGTGITLGEHNIAEGDWLTFDGAGALFKGKIPSQTSDLNDPRTIQAAIGDSCISSWDQFAKGLGEWAHATHQNIGGMEVGLVTSKPEALARAVKFGARGNTLFRTEDLFYGAQHQLLKDYFLTDDPATASQVKAHLKQGMLHYLREAQKIRGDFPTNIRLFDIPFKDWLPEEQAALKQKYGETIVNARGEPMSGGPLLSADERIYRLQVEAIFEAVKECDYRHFIGIAIHNVTDISQVAAVERFIREEQQRCVPPRDIGMNIHDDTMALSPEIIKNIAPRVKTVIIGANDLTADITGICRSDSKAMEEYQTRHRLPESISKKLAPEVEAIIRERVGLWKRHNPALKVIFSSGHAMKSMEAIHEMGADYIGVAPTEMNLALATMKATQLALRQPRKVGVVGAVYTGV